MARILRVQYPEYLKRAGQRASWLRVDRVLGELGIRREDTAGRKLFAQAMEERRGKDKPGEWQSVRRGWFLGGAQLREWAPFQRQRIDRSH